MVNWPAEHWSGALGHIGRIRPIRRDAKGRRTNRSDRSQSARDFGRSPRRSIVPKGEEIPAFFLF
jgi:hypothetical protein